MSGDLFGGTVTKAKRRVVKQLTRYDLAPGESMKNLCWIVLWQCGIPEKQARRTAVYTDIGGFMEMGRKGFLAGEALAEYYRRREQA